MAGDHSFYPGADYGLDSEYGKGESFHNFGYRTPAGAISAPTDARTANQVQAVSNRINLGVKSIEVSGLTLGGRPMTTMDSIPKQHFKEINRLKQLTGVDFTFHGPLVEPTGISRNGWDPSHRAEAEAQLLSAVERGHELEPKGNIIVTLHSSNGLPQTETNVINEKGELVTKEIWVVDKRGGNFKQIPIKENYMLGQKPDADKEVERMNKEAWVQQLQEVDFYLKRGKDSLDEADRIWEKSGATEMEKSKLNNPLEFYDYYKTEEGQKFVNSLQPSAKKFAERITSDVNFADLSTRTAYHNLQEIFNRAWVSFENNPDKKEEFEKLKKYRDDISKSLKKFEESTNIDELSKEVTRGVQLLTNLEKPEIFTPLRKFAVDQASETFSNLAYKSFKKFKDTAPIISVENSPGGEGLSTAEELKDIVKTSREKFVEKAKNDGMSESEAKERANKLIGATWDVGHINMLRKYGYGDKELEGQTKTIAPFIKHIHLSDNFGMEHTELPMGMGNVPMEKYTKILKDQFGEKLKQIKQVVETGNWYEPFKSFPFKETLRAFGSSVYASGAGGPYWNQSPAFVGGYFAGYGMNPEIHHSVYGAGFSGLPTELGGQIPGRQSRFSGTPME